MMAKVIIARKKSELDAGILHYRENNETISLVPTMGALHEGHLNLVKLAKQKSDRTIVSIYVNPAQFAPGEDFEAYPRSENDDISLLIEEKVDLIYIPDPKSMYNVHHATKIIVGGVAEGLETDHRPTFFEGVALIVTKLLNRVTPDYAIFGEKDYQQLSIIRHVVAKENWPVEIVPGPISREADGLAMSSRNMRLLPNERKESAQIYAVLSRAISTLDLEKTTRKTFEKACIKALDEVPSIRVEYVSCCDAASLQPLDEFNTSRPARVFAAVQCGKVRLIDNLPLF